MLGMTNLIGNGEGGGVLPGIGGEDSGATKEAIQEFINNGGFTAMEPDKLQGILDAMTELKAILGELLAEMQKPHGEIDRSVIETADENVSNMLVDANDNVDSIEEYDDTYINNPDELEKTPALTKVRELIQDILDYIDMDESDVEDDPTYADYLNNNTEFDMSQTPFGDALFENDTSDLEARLEKIMTRLEELIAMMNNGEDVEPLFRGPFSNVGEDQTDDDIETGITDLFGTVAETT